MVSSDIWMGSGATVSMIPEQNINLGALGGIKAASGNQREINLHPNFVANFMLVPNLYRGCYLNIYAVSGNALTDRVLIQSNTKVTLTVNDSLASTITDNPTLYYGVIEQYGAPVPAPLGTDISATDIAQVVEFTFNDPASFALADFDDKFIEFHYIASSDGGTSTVFRIGLSDGGSYGGAGSADATVDIASDADEEDIVDGIIAQVTGQTAKFVLSKSGSGSNTTLIVTSTNSGASTFLPHTDLSTHIRVNITTVSYNDANPRLLSDTWLGLATGVGIPTTTIQTDPMNLLAGGTRNHIYQYKGIETTDNGSLDLTANSFWPLYYVLGKKSITTPASAETSHTPTNRFKLASGSGTGFIYTVADDTIHRTEGTTICPPLDETAVLGNHLLINNDDVENDFITYTITEENGQQLPSFALEYTLKKGDQNATVAVDSSKENVYSKIYPGTVVNSLTMNADTAGPVNMNLSLAHKKTFVADTSYETLNNATDVKEFINYRGRQGQTETLASDSDANTEPLMRPFFFADGTISMFGVDYIRLASFNLVIDNQLQAQRYIGRYDKNSQNQLNGQRTYQLSFTGHVTDAAVFTELQNQLATALSSATSEIVLRFTKENGEELTMKFRDYMVTSASFPVNNDRGPIVVDWTIQPLTMQECTHTTYWAIQG